MKFHRLFTKPGHVGVGLSAVLAAGMFGAVLVPVQPVQAAPRELEIWPGTRVLALLPLKVSSGWNQDASLGNAIIPLVEPELQKALANTRKFAITVPYRFDPVLQRAIGEKALPDDTIKALLDTPSLATAQAVYGQLHFEQPAMIAEVNLEELRLGGTQSNPTVQLVVSSKLFEAGATSPFVTPLQVTSAPMSGGRPEDRIVKAARDAFAQVAAQFVAPPPSFALPGPKISLPATPVKPVPPVKPAVRPAPVTPVNPVPPAIPSTGVPVLPPNSISPPQGQDFIPQLPPSQPPLGITVPNEPVLGR